MADTFTALVAEQTDGRTVVKRTSLEEAALPPGDVTIDVAYSPQLQGRAGAPRSRQGDP
jgi:hypothetical protein